MKRDALDPGLDQPFRNAGRVAIAAAAGIVGVIGDDQRLVAGLAGLAQATASATESNLTLS